MSRQANQQRRPAAWHAQLLAKEHCMPDCLLVASTPCSTCSSLRLAASDQCCRTLRHSRSLAGAHRHAPAHAHWAQTCSSACLPTSQPMLECLPRSPPRSPCPRSPCSSACLPTSQPMPSQPTSQPPLSPAQVHTHHRVRPSEAAAPAPQQLQRPLCPSLSSCSAHCGRPSAAAAPAACVPAPAPATQAAGTRAASGGRT